MSRGVLSFSFLLSLLPAASAQAEDPLFLELGHSVALASGRANRVPVLSIDHGPDSQSELYRALEWALHDSFPWGDPSYDQGVGFLAIANAFYEAVSSRPKSPALSQYLEFFVPEAKQRAEAVLSPEGPFQNAVADLRAWHKFNGRAWITLRQLEHSIQDLAFRLAILQKANGLRPALPIYADLSRRLTQLNRLTWELLVVHLRLPAGSFRLQRALKRIALGTFETLLPPGAGPSNNVFLSLLAYRSAELTEHGTEEASHRPLLLARTIAKAAGIGAFHWVARTALETGMSERWLIRFRYFGNNRQILRLTSSEAFRMLGHRIANVFHVGDHALLEQYSLLRAEVMEASCPEMLSSTLQR
jgi:hypothetical protein